MGDRGPRVHALRRGVERRSRRTASLDDDDTRHGFLCSIAISPEWLSLDNGYSWAEQQATCEAAGMSLPTYYDLCPEGSATSQATAPYAFAQSDVWIPYSGDCNDAESAAAPSDCPGRPSRPLSSCSTTPPSTARGAARTGKMIRAARRGCGAHSTRHRPGRGVAHHLMRVLG